jgi:predicted DNA-binding transcriptional regulator YafY
MSTPPVITRVHRLHLIAKALRSGDRVKASWLSSTCECCSKTIYRDVKFMRRELGWEITWDANAETYRLVSSPEPVL